MRRGQLSQVDELNQIERVTKHHTHITCYEPKEKIMFDVTQIVIYPKE